MSSLKMTFSLASLVLILGLIAMPVMAQEDMAVPLGDVMIQHLQQQQNAAGDAEGRFIVIGVDANDAGHRLP